MWPRRDVTLAAAGGVGCFGVFEDEKEEHEVGAGGGARAVFVLGVCV